MKKINSLKKIIFAAFVVCMMLQNHIVNASVNENATQAQYVRLGTSAQDAPLVNFNTLYAIDDDGYVAVKPEKDCYIDVPIGDTYSIDESQKYKAGEVVYILLKLDSACQFMICNYDDVYGDSDEEAAEMNTNQEYSGTIASDKDVDCFKFTSDITGKAKLIFKKNQSGRMSVDVSLYDSGRELGGCYISSNTDEWYMNLQEGWTYCMYVSEGPDYNEYPIEYSIEVVTAQVESIDFDQPEASILVRDQYQLHPVILPENVVDGTVEYKSSDENVAVVSEKGMVFAKNAGVATIFCMAKDGSSTEGICKIIVKNPITDHTPVITALTNLKNGKVKVNVKKDIYAFGYQVKYSTSKSMRNAKSITAKSTGQIISNLSIGKKYYFQARAYALNGDGKKIYSKYSNAKAIKVSRK